MRAVRGRIVELGVGRMGGVGTQGMVGGEGGLAEGAFGVREDWELCGWN